ncbi:ATP-binding protein [Aquabacterium sp. J223]|uniref:sensor histidine kinase n=1 Tax=Aquabacterium sp. J223 TaxID=2898431 RepID=UPI0021AD9383|nr:ATP-binding protein [Aquabacterium sp. J223]UUX95089.1 ATP-binding protein [Aquabacterium sp. J223]
MPLDAYRPTFVKSLVMVPIRPDDPIGAIGTYWARPQALAPERVALLQALADTTSVAMENVTLVNDLERRVRERTTALEQANEALEAFSVSVSHDLRAPLRAVQGFAQLLDERAGERLDADGRHLLSGVRQAAGRMDALMDELMKLAQVGRREPVCRSFDLAPMAREVVQRLQTAEPGRRVHVDIADPLPVHADPGLLRLALENLVGNAWKYTGRRDEAHIAVQPWADDGRSGFCVRDNGAGFDMARAERLFEPFRRLHSEDEFSGTGIGLAIVRRVVQQHGGRIHAEARPGEGATFYVALPTG